MFLGRLCVSCSEAAVQVIGTVWHRLGRSSCSRPQCAYERCTAGPRQAPLAASGGGRSQRAFQGTARTLAGDAPAQQAAQQPEGAPLGGSAGQAAGAAGSAQQPIVHTIAFYSNGIFTVDDGGRLPGL